MRLFDKNKEEGEPHYKNPLFPKEKMGFFKSFRKVFYSFLFLAVLGIGVYFFLFSEAYEIREIKVEDNEFISTENVNQIIQEILGKKRFFIFKKSNLIVLSEKEILNALREKIQEKQALEDIKVIKEYPDILKIIISERIPRLTLFTTNKIFVIDLNGIITREIALAEVREEFPKINITEGGELKINDKVISSDLVEKIFYLKEKLAERTNQFEVESFHLPKKDGNEIWIKTEDDFLIYFDKDSNLDAQIDKLVLLFKEKEINKKTLNYIDLRFPERVYISPSL